jgi:hypothetical protein
MTLHSVASCYSDRPSQEEKTLMSTWLTMFQTTITCPSCREHFGTALDSYRRNYPRMLDSRSEFLLFTFRAHNAVNRRLNKPVHLTVELCFEQLRNNVKTRSARDYRIAYINHIRRHWRVMQDASGFTSLKKISEMAKIETQYFERHENNFEVIIPENSVLLPSELIVSPGSETPSPMRFDTRLVPKLGLTNGRFQMRR